MYKITFDQIGEVRMGSPYNSARVHVTGGYFPEAIDKSFPEGFIGSFQDKYAVSDDGLICFLIAWNSPKNEPGFVIWKVSDVERSVKVSKKISGCCEDISYSSETNTITLVVWEHPHGERIEKITI